jgi:hypothetical protein
MSKLKGSWTADYQNWVKHDPEMGQMRESTFNMIMGDLDVSFTDEGFAIRGYGSGKDMEGTYKITDDSGDKVAAELYLGGSTDRKALWEFEFPDDDHMVMRMTSPKADLLAVKRS